MEDEIARVQSAAMIRRGAESHVIADQAMTLNAQHADAQAMNGLCATKIATPRPDLTAATVGLLFAMPPSFE